MLTGRNFDIIGVLTKNPERAKTQSGANIARAMIAVTETYKGKDGQYKSNTSYFEVSAYNPNAIDKLLQGRRGDQIRAVGTINSMEKQARDGSRYYNYYLNVVTVSLGSEESTPTFNTGPAVEISNDDLPF